MPDIPFEAFIRMVAKNAATIFARTKSIAPVFITVDAEGHWVLTDMQRIWGNDAASKDKVFAFARAVAKEKRAVRCAWVSEAWTLSSSTDPASIAMVKHWCENVGNLEHAPGRREVVQISAEDRLEGGRIAEMEIVRPEGQEPYLLTLRLLERFEFSKGREVGLLVAGRVS